MAKEWKEKVFEVQRVSDRIILVKLILASVWFTVLSVYAPQSGVVMRLRTCSLISCVL